MAHKKVLNPLAAAIGSAVVAGLCSTAIANAAENPFGLSALDGGYMQVAEGKCGQGKCGGAKPAESKCGAGKCGGAKPAEGKCGEGKCGGAKKTEGKCGEGKCGGAKPAEIGRAHV